MQVFWQNWLAHHVLLSSSDLPALAHPLDGLSWWSLTPFVLILLGIAILPQAIPHLWEQEWFRVVFSASLGLPVLLWIAFVDMHSLQHTLQEYTTFLLLLTALYTICGGLYLQGHFSGTPTSNALLLLAGTCSASLIGTTGAAMFFIRPILRGNLWRRYRSHTVISFIFLVCNIGGLLTPLGDPPLFLGFLRSVPFTWTFHFWPIWLLLSSALLLGYWLLDSYLFRQEDPSKHARKPVPIVLQGKINAIYLGLVVLTILLSGMYHWPFGVQEACLTALICGSWFTTPAQIHHANRFSWIPIREVGVLFFGIFLTMIPALALLNSHGKELPLHTPSQFFWVSGLLSAFLDNAPTYLAFSATASSLLGTDAGNLSQLLHSTTGVDLLRAISVGSVCMGALTYIGNGPNLIIKSIAEQESVPMPSFFGYLGISVLCLIPLFVLVNWIHF